MKKTYISPETSEILVEVQQLLTKSLDGNGSNPFDGAEEGGEGEEGDSRLMRNVWDDEF
ncbi:MAG: hypothetical protein J6W19_02390 [Prevotella sp.]|nr:hypothetical protein [Prevotella sp.]